MLVCFLTAFIIMGPAFVMVLIALDRLDSIGEKIRLCASDEELDALDAEINAWL